MAKKVVIVGGHGKISQRLASLLSPHGHSVTSIIRDPAQSATIQSLPATPLVLSLEDDPAPVFSKAFAGADVVYFSAGAGGKGGEERTKKIDWEGAVKVFDAIEGLGEVDGGKSGKKPMLVLVSAMDVRAGDRIPEHYMEEDKAYSARSRKVLGKYMEYKYLADKDLVQRTAFKWIILRPGTLSDEAGTGKAVVGRAHLGAKISRDDVAKALALLVDREDAAGLAIDLAGDGNTPIEQGLDEFIKKGETDWAG